MNDDDFKEQVEKGLKKLNREQQVEFAWRSAVRALPFLGAKGSFYFWEKEKRPTYLYSVFYALDCAAYSAADADAAAYGTDAAYTASATNAEDAVYAVAAAASAAYASTNVDNAANVENAAIAANMAANAAEKCHLNLEFLILNDLKIMNKKNRSVDSISFYGEIWDNFQRALEAEGCAYWGILYKKLFEKNFQLDKEDISALKIRLNVPKEIRQQEAVTAANYLEALDKKGGKRLNEARVIILGDKGAGKTCLARRLIDPSAAMTTECESTAGVDTTLWTLEADDINIRIWDFAGHTVTHAVHQFFLSERCLYLLVYNGRTEEKGRLDYWLDQMKNYGGKSEAIILVNERDSHRAEIHVNALKEKYPIAGVYYFSIKEDKDDLLAFRETVAQAIKTNPAWQNQVMPGNYFEVKEALEVIFSQDKKEHITKERFNTIADQYGVTNKDSLLQALHCLGISLWYKDMEEFNTLVLNPEWISHGVYKIINWVHESKRYGLSLTDFELVFANDADRYPIKQHKFLFKLMRYYELAFETNGGELIIPHLLKEDRPEILPEFYKDDLKLKYEANQPLPPHTISRFIVRHNQQIKINKQDETVWRYGVILDDGRGSLALVRENDRTISVSVKGDDKTNFITELRASFNDIFDSYKSDKPELQYKVTDVTQ